MAQKKAPAKPAQPEYLKLMAEAEAAEQAHKAELDEIAAQEAELAASKAAIAGDVAAKKAAADAAFDAAMAPDRAVRDGLLLAKEAIVTERTAAESPIVAKFNEDVAALVTKRDADLEAVAESYAPKLEAVDSDLKALYEKVLAEKGVAEALFNGDLLKKVKTYGGKGGSPKADAKHLSLAAVGETAAHVIVAKQRANNPDGDKVVVVKYQVARGKVEDGTFTPDSTGNLHLCAVRVGGTNKEGKVLVSDTDVDFTHISETPAKVTTTPGWHDTDDVMWALAKLSGVAIPTSFGPTNPDSTIGVVENGEYRSLGTKPAAEPAEAVEETV